MGPAKSAATPDSVRCARASQCFPYATPASEQTCNPVIVVVVVNGDVPDFTMNWYTTL